MTEIDLNLDPAIATARVGIDNFTQVLHNAGEQKAATLAVLQQGKRLLHILSRDLDPRILDDQAITDALSALARRSKFSDIKILVMEPEVIIQRGHRWLELFQRLSSRIEVRIVHDDYKSLPVVFTIVDEAAIVLRSNANEMEGYVSFHQPKECAERLVYFNEVWSSSLPATEFRRIHL